MLYIVSDDDGGAKWLTCIGRQPANSVNSFNDYQNSPNPESNALLDASSFCDSWWFCVGFPLTQISPLVAKICAKNYFHIFVSSYPRSFHLIFNLVQLVTIT